MRCLFLQHNKHLTYRSICPPPTKPTIFQSGPHLVNLKQAESISRKIPSFVHLTTIDTHLLSDGQKRQIFPVVKSIPLKTNRGKYKRTTTTSENASTHRRSGRTLRIPHVRQPRPRWSSPSPRPPAPLRSKPRPGPAACGFLSCAPWVWPGSMCVGYSFLFGCGSKGSQTDNRSSFFSCSFLLLFFWGAGLRVWVCL